MKRYASVALLVVVILGAVVVVVCRSKSIERQRQHATEVRLGGYALAICAYRVEYGDWPLETRWWQVVDHLKETDMPPRDSWGSIVVFDRAESLVYSVGPNRKSDGRSGDDIVVRFNDLYKELEEAGAAAPHSQ